MVEFDELIEKDFNIDRDSIPPEEQKKYLMNLLLKDLLNLRVNTEELINPDKLIYNYKTEEISRPKDFSNYQNPVELFKYLRDVHINPKEVLKDQINFK